MQASSPTSSKTTRAATPNDRPRHFLDHDDEKLANGERTADGQLPMPATASKRARIDSEPRRGLRVHWARFIRRMNNPGSGSYSSESVIDVPESTGDSEQDHAPKCRITARNSQINATTADAKTKDEEEEEDVDEVVVDNVLINSGRTGSITHSERLTSGDNGQSTGKSGDESHSHQSQGEKAVDHLTDGWSLLAFLRFRVWPPIYSFFDSRFHDPHSEAAYQREIWFDSKSLALWGTLFYILNYGLTNGAMARPLLLYDKIFIWGVAPITTFAMPFMVIYDVPRKQNSLWQITLAISIWQWAIFQIIIIGICGFYNPRQSIVSCGGKEFLGLFYNTSALPAVGMFALRQTRLSASICASVAFILTTALILPDKHTFFRLLLNFVAFHVFMIYMHYKREASERRLYKLREQLKIQFKATQKAQVSERKAADSKRRLTSYIFHEVRVPLNTALLAVQNMEASGCFAKNKGNIEHAALEGSLSMMSKVLNDVLDFNRLDAGRFEQVSKPYNFHTVLQSLLAPIRLAADSRGLELVVEFDPDIERIARKTFYVSQGLDAEAIEERMREDNSEDALVLGDEMRLRQIVTNLASNATKFTDSGGKVRIVTKLVHPQFSISCPSVAHVAQGRNSGEHLSPDSAQVPLSTTKLFDHDMMQCNFQNIVVRIEIHDTGVGIRKRELVDQKLFSPYVQTEIGKYQGGKGTGLGLALVRRIVKLSGGRLGVKSKVGVGSTFWVELSLGVGSRVLAEMPPNSADAPGGGQRSRDNRGLHVYDRPFTPHPLARIGSGDYEFLVSQPPTPAASIEYSSSNIASSTEGPLPPGTAAFRNVMEQRSPLELSTPPPGRPPRPTPTDGPVISLSSTPDTPPSKNPLESPLVAKQPTTLSDPPSPSYPQLQTAQASTATLTMPGPPLRCLVVDDDVLTRKLMSRMLTRMGCNVDTAPNGQSALEMIVTPDDKLPGPSSPASGSTIGAEYPMLTTHAEGKYDVIFLDNQMPLMSGLEAVEQLREAGRTDFVVGVTGNAMITDQKEYLQAGANRVLTKPVLEKSLRQMLILADQNRQSRFQQQQQDAKASSQNTATKTEKAPS